MQHIHWLGTGLSSIPGIRRISQNYENVTIWNRTLEKAQESISHVDKQNVTAKKFDIESLTSVLNAGDIVVSQLPANHHLTIAKLCLDKKCHFASSSYISPDMKNLNDEAKRNHLVFVNEVGLDPGIDHFFSHLLVKKLKQTGHTRSVKNLVIQQAKLAAKANLDAFVCSAHEVPYVKKIFKKEIITPGIKLMGDKAKDQKRIMTPKKAFENGATSIVIGRSITQGNIKKNIQRLIKSLN